MRPRELWSRLPRLIRVGVASGAATGVDTALLLGLCWLGGIGPGPAAFVASLAGGAVNFTINRRWVFGRRGGPWLAQALAYGLVVVLGGAGLGAVAVAAGVAVGLPLLIAKAAAVVAVLLGWTYPMSARVFGRRSLPAGTGTAGARPHSLSSPLA